LAQSSGRLRTPSGHRQSGGGGCTVPRSTVGILPWSAVHGWIQRLHVAGSRWRPDNPNEAGEGSPRPEGHGPSPGHGGARWTDASTRCATFPSIPASGGSPAVGKATEWLPSRTHPRPGAETVLERRQGDGSESSREPAENALRVRREASLEQGGRFRRPGAP